MSNIMRDFIDAAIRRETAEKNSLCAHYLAATGADPRDLVLCEQQDPRTGTIRWWIETKDECDARPLAVGYDYVPSQSYIFPDICGEYGTKERP